MKPRTEICALVVIDHFFKGNWCYYPDSWFHTQSGRMYTSVDAHRYDLGTKNLDRALEILHNAYGNVIAQVFRFTGNGRETEAFWVSV